jgi:hypothetical protein
VRMLHCWRKGQWKKKGRFSRSWGKQGKEISSEAPGGSAAQPTPCFPSETEVGLLTSRTEKVIRGVSLPRLSAVTQSQIF